jgi:hypothetical protein
VTSELSGSSYGYGTDRPGETGTGTDRDITPVPEHAGRNIGITRAELYNQLYGDHAGADSRGEATDTAEDSSDGSGQASVSRPGVDAGAVEGTDTSGNGGGYHDGTDGDNGDSFGPSPEPTEQDVKGSAVGTRVRPDMPNGAEATGSALSARGTGRDSSRDQAVDGTAPPEGNQADSEDGRDTGGPDRTAGGQDTGRARHPDHGSDNAGKALRTGTETTEPTARRAGAAEDETTQALSADTPEPKQKDQPDEQNPAPDASPDQPGETATEAQPDQHDEQRWAALEQRIQAMQDTLDTAEARHKAETAQLKQKIDDLEARLEAVQPKQQSVHDRSPDSGGEPAPSGTSDVAEPGKRRDVLDTSDGSGNTADRAETDVVNKRLSSESDREATPGFHERSGFSTESVNAGKEALGLAGALGFLPPGLQLVVAGDSARRAIEEMPPEDQYAAMKLADTAVTAFSSMPPGTAMAALGASILGPAVHARFRDIFHKIIRKD